MPGHRCADWFAPTMEAGQTAAFCVWCAWLAEHHEARRLRVRTAELERMLEQTLQQLDRERIPR